MALKKPDPTQVAAFLACTDQMQLAAILGTTRERLLFHLYSRKAPSYRTFGIPKAAGGVRQIEAPPVPISIWQRHVAALLAALYERKKPVHGFTEGGSICTNADRHIGKRVILNIDLLDFFPSIHFGRVRGLFRKPPFSFNDTVASTLAQLCTNNRKLPQGAPSSPVVSNLVCRGLDNELERLCKRYSCTYTRYADDITISSAAHSLPVEIVESHAGDGSQVILGHRLTASIGKHDFAVNSKKSRIRTNRQRQEVTGLVVNQRRNVCRGYVSDLRAALHKVKQSGYATAESEYLAASVGRSRRHPGSPSLRANISGRLEFLKMVRGAGDALHARYALDARRLELLDKPVQLTGGATRWIGLLRQTVWIVVGQDSTGSDCFLGTAFSLQGEIVSARHVFDEDPNLPMQSWWLQRNVAPFERYHVTSILSHPAIDVTILGTTALTRGCLKRSEAGSSTGDSVTLVGFPNPHSIGDLPLRAGSVIVQQVPLAGVLHFSVGYPLLGGASGGPVLNDLGEVIGVIVHTGTNPVLPNAFIAIENLLTVRHRGIVNNLP